jgi:hypothetical protein
MQVKFFQIPTSGCEAVEAEMNAFLRSHRVLKVDRELVQRETASAWAVCVEYLEGSVSGVAGPRGSGRGEDKKIDYKAMLIPRAACFWPSECSAGVSPAWVSHSMAGWTPALQ